MLRLFADRLRFNKSADSVILRRLQGSRCLRVQISLGVNVATDETERLGVRVG